MRYASEDLLSKGKDPNNDTAFDTAVSCDDRWQKRSYSSLNSVVTDISMNTDKILDIETMTRTCKSCFHMKN